MLDIIARIALSFTHEPVIVPIILLGLICLDRKIFYDATCLLLLVMIYSMALKVTFRVPLPAEFGKGNFAFPSGHMKAATVFYGWIASKYRNILLKIFVSLLLVSLGFALVHFGYHNYIDVIGGVFFASLLIALYHLISLK